MTDEQELSDIIWAPWRMDYILSREEYTEGCFICDAVEAESGDWKEHKLLRKGEQTVILLNKFPYNNGHALVAPIRHVGNLTDLTEAENGAVMGNIRRYVRVVRDTMNADGFNIGFNLGEAAGAGIPQHLHAHVVPRWEGDTNFMPVTGNTRVIPQSLDELYDKLREVL